MNEILNKAKNAKLIHDTENLQFRLPVNNDVAKVDYKMKNGSMYLTHSEVPHSMRGQGIGKVLVEKVFTYLQTNNINASSICPYIVAKARRNEKWKEFLNE